MMQGIVMEGTGKAAQLNGYSAGGKTGTANKIDPATHTYSHTKLVASFAGFAPVSAPAVSIAVVIDTPTIGSSFYGAAVSAPVFHDVAQQVLEYLGVPHDQPLKTQAQMLEARNDTQVDDTPGQQVGDLKAMFDEVNSLPADDPLRQPATAAAMAENVQADAASDAARAAHTKPPGGLSGLPDKVMEAFHANRNTTSVMPDTTTTTAKVEALNIRPLVAAQNGGVVVDAGKRVAVPEFKGDGLRTVVQDASRLGLRVQTLGSGLAREQAPAAGTMVPLGTEVVVRFAR